MFIYTAGTIVEAITVVIFGVFFLSEYLDRRRRERKQSDAKKEMSRNEKT